MPKHLIEADLLNKADKDHEHTGYLDKNGYTPNRIAITNNSGEVVVKQDLHVSQLDHLKNVTSDIQAQINTKANEAHIHNQYITQEDLVDVTFSGKSEDVSYNPANANLESTNVKSAIDEVDNKIEVYITKLTNDKTELKQDIANTNKNLSDTNTIVSNISKVVETKAPIDHTHEGSEHIHQDLIDGIGNNSTNISKNSNEIAKMNQTLDGLGSTYASKIHTHSDLQSQIDAINIDITDHQHLYLEEMVSSVDKKVSANTTTISEAKTDITNIKKDITENFPTFEKKGHTHPEIDVEITNHTHTDIEASVVAIDDRVTALKDIYAPKIHAHDDYAAKTHTHDFSFEHDHDNTYAPKNHNHLNYADVEHYHNDIYAPKVHTHSGEFAPTVHTHSDLANKEHTHNEFSTFELASNKNKVNGYVGLDGEGKIPLEHIPDITTEHTHTISDITDLDLVHTHPASEVSFLDGEDLQTKLDNGSLGGTGGGDNYQGIIGSILSKEIPKEFYEAPKPPEGTKCVLCSLSGSSALNTQVMNIWYFSTIISPTTAGTDPTGVWYGDDTPKPGIYLNGASATKRYEYVGGVWNSVSQTSLSSPYTGFIYFANFDVLRNGEVNRPADSVETGLGDFNLATKSGYYNINAKGDVLNSPIEHIEGKLFVQQGLQTIVTNDSKEYRRIFDKDIFSDWKTDSEPVLKEYPILETENSEFITNINYEYGDVRRYGIESGVISKTTLAHVLSFQKNIFIPKDFELLMNSGVILTQGCSFIGEDRKTSIIKTSFSGTVFGIDGDFTIKNLSMIRGTTGTPIFIKAASKQVALDNIVIENVSLIGSNNAICFYNSNYVTSLTNVSIKNVKIQGLNKATSNGVGIELQGATNVNMENVEISNVYYGITLGVVSDYKDIYMDNLTIKDTRSGIYSASMINKLTSVFLSNSVFKNNTSYDLYLSLEYMTIKNCTFEKLTENTTASMYLTRAKEFYLESNTFIGYNVAINLLSLTNIIVNANTFLNCTTNIEKHASAKVVDVLETINRVNQKETKYPILELEGDKVKYDDFPYGHFYRYFKPLDASSPKPDEVILAIRNASTLFSVCYVPNGTWNTNNLPSGYIGRLIGESKEETILVGFNGSLIDGTHVENITFKSHTASQTRQGFTRDGVGVNNISFINVDFINILSPIYINWSSGATKAYINNLYIDRVRVINETSTVNTSYTTIRAKGLLGEIVIKNSKFIRQLGIIKLDSPYTSLDSIANIDCNIKIEDCIFDECTDGIFSTSPGFASRDGKKQFICIKNSTMRNSGKCDIDITPPLEGNEITALDIQNNVFIGIGTTYSTKLSDKINNITLLGNKFLGYDVAINNIGTITDIHNTFIDCNTDIVNTNSVNTLGKQSVFVSATEPTQAQIGDFWLDTSSNI